MSLSHTVVAIAGALVVVASWVPSRVAAQGSTREVRESAVFALSQQRNGVAVPALIQIARTNRDPKIRRSAMFWLGQSKDPRALALFEEILTRR